MRVRSFGNFVNATLVDYGEISSRKYQIEKELKQFQERAEKVASKGDMAQATKIYEKAIQYRKAMEERPHPTTISESLEDEISASRNPKLWEIMKRKILPTVDTALGKFLTEEGRLQMLQWLCKVEKDDSSGIGDKLIKIMMSCGSRVSKLSELLILRQDELNLVLKSTNEGKVLDIQTEDGFRIKSIQEKDGRRVNSLTINGEEISTAKFNQANNSNSPPDSQRVTIQSNTSEKGRLIVNLLNDTK